MANPLPPTVGAKATAHIKANAQKETPVTLLHSSTILLLRTADQGRVRGGGQFVHFNISYRIRYHSHITA